MKNTTTLCTIAMMALSLIASGCAGESATTAQGAEGQACYPNATCNSGLTCDANLCVVDEGGGSTNEDDGGSTSGTRAVDAGPQDTSAPPQPEGDAGTPSDTSAAPSDSSGPGDTAALSDSEAPRAQGTLVTPVQQTTIASLGSASLIWVRTSAARPVRASAPPAGPVRLSSSVALTRPSSASRTSSTSATPAPLRASANLTRVKRPACPTKEKAASAARAAMSTPTAHPASSAKRRPP